MALRDAIQELAVGVCEWRGRIFGNNSPRSATRRPAPQSRSGPGPSRDAGDDRAPGLSYRPDSQNASFGRKCSVETAKIKVKSEATSTVFLGHAQDLFDGGGSRPPPVRGVLGSRYHALLHRDAPDLARGGLAEDQAADLLGDDEQNERPDVPLVPGLPAALLLTPAPGTAPPPACPSPRWPADHPGPARPAPCTPCRSSAPAAAPAPPRARRQQERLDPHVQEPRDRPGRVVGVQRPEHQVPRQGRVHRVSAVSRSRISPTMITSGSCRTMSRSAAANVSRSAAAPRSG